MNLRRTLIGFSLLLLLAACAAPPLVSVPEELETAGALSRSGRFSVRVEEVAGETEAVQGGFAWYDSGTQVLLDLNTPIGTALARVEVAADGTAVLSEANGQRTQAASADELVERVLGSPIPVQELRYWLRGLLPARPRSSGLQQDDAGRPVRFIQSGWSVRIDDYDKVGPLRMQLHRIEPGVRTIEVRLVMTPAPAP